MLSFKIGAFDSSRVFETLEDIELEPLQAKESTLSIKERDGIIDFSFSNMYKRYIYEDRIVTIKGIFRYNSIDELYEKINNIYSYVYNNVQNELELSITPGVKWDATLLNIQKQEITGQSTGRIIIQYRVYPFSHSTQEIVYSGIVSTNPRIELRNPGTAPTNKHILALTNISGNNDGIFIERPDGTFISCSKVFEDGDYFTIDFSKFEMTVNGERVKNLEWDGDFFELSTGINPLEIAFTGSCNIKWYVTPQYFYSKPKD